MSLRIELALAGLTGALVTLSANLSLAQDALPQCDDVAFQNPIFGAGGSAITATLRRVAPFLAGLPEPVTIVFADPSACTGYREFLSNAVNGTFKYWEADGTERQCLPRVGGQPVDFAHMGNPADFCQDQTLPADVVDLQGPVQTLNFIVDRDSDQQAISAEAVYFVFGLGAEGQVAPWTNTTHVVQRNSTSFVHLFAAAAVGLPPNSFVTGGTVLTNQDEIINAVVQFGALSPRTPIGYVSGSAADSRREDVRTLAFQSRGASCAFFPDSTANALDKINVRTGDYPIWTPGHFFYRLNPGTTTPQNQLVADALGWIAGTVPTPNAAGIVANIIASGDIPQCAMRAQRSGLVGPITPFAPVEPCHCFFERTATGAASAACTECTDDNQCSGAAPKCRLGYCEAN